MAVGRSEPLVSGSPSASPRNLVRLSANQTNETAFRTAQKPRTPIRTNGIEMRQGVRIDLLWVAETA